jgi:hypothetical protein
MNNQTDQLAEQVAEDSQLVKYLKTESRLPRFLDLFKACDLSMQMGRTPMKEARQIFLDYEFKNYLLENPSEHEAYLQLLRATGIYGPSSVQLISRISRLADIVNDALSPKRSLNLKQKQTSIAMFDVQPGA